MKCNCGLCAYPCAREGGYQGGPICEWCFKDFHRPERDYPGAFCLEPMDGDDP